MKKIICIISLMLMLLSVLTVAALEPPPRWGFGANMSGDFYYQILPDETIEVWYDGVESVIEIPETLDGFVVTQIGTYAIDPNTFFNDRDGTGAMKTIVIPDSVTYISFYAFDGFPELVVIYGHSGSVAEKFASESGMVFISLDDEMPVAIQIVGEKFSRLLDFDEIPVIENDILFIPFRATFEGMNRIFTNLFTKVEWDNETRTASATLYEDWNIPPQAIKTVRLTIGSDTAYIDDIPVQLDAPSKIINNRTLIPLSFITDNFDFSVDWNETLRIVTITLKYDTFTKWINTRITY